MPVNKNALIRYRTIDKCLQNRQRKWTIEALMDACTEALYEFEGIDKPISLRTIRLDLNAMRSDKLGYNAPIVVTNKKYYSYEDSSYSITNSPLTSQDLYVLQEVTQLLNQFKGFSHFNEVVEIVNKLEDKIYSEKHQKASVIDFEKNELLIGIEHLNILYKHIIHQNALFITYQSFKARGAAQFVFYPYLLKEYRNRWFILGMKKKTKELLTLALDRIVSIELATKEVYQVSKNFDPNHYFKDIVGVTKNTDTKLTTVQFLANWHQAPYIKTKPIHHSQKIVEERKEGVVFSLQVIPNYELERELLGFGDGLIVLAPSQLVRLFKRKAKLMYQVYHESNIELQGKLDTV